MAAGVGELLMGRFRLVRQLGAGGMGVVIEAEDRERHERVALKRVKQRDPDALYRLKKEFRSLADVRHPNLVRLYDLVVEEEDCFFTMELVAGHDLVAACTGRTSAPGAHDETARATAPRFDEPRTRDYLRQLAAGLVSLHEAGKIHRDIKPSNVLVDHGGRVVILDFGLATDSHRASHESLVGQIVGTAAYMAPEQARGDVEVTPAADWYAVGAVLYEILTGAPPHVGGVVDVMMAKQRDAPRPPRELAPACPEDLAELAMRLLTRDPADRPSPREVLRILGGSPSSISESAHSGQSASTVVGRDAEIAALVAAVRDPRDGSAVLALVSGAPGIGRTTVLQQLARELRRAPDALVLTGRCYRQESVPYKALDEVIDGLARHLRAMPAAELEAVLPADVALAAHIFPVLRRVEAIALAHARSPAPHEASIRDRLSAFDALRALLSALARTHRLVIVIDDLHWSDADSLVLLIELLRPVDGRGPAVVASYASASQDPPPAIERLRDAELLRDAAISRSEWSLPPLGYTQCLALARMRLGATEPDVDALADSIAREAGGNPLAIDELVRVALGGDTTSPLESARSTDQRIRVRLAALPVHARRLLEMIAVSDGPVPADVAHRAAGLSPEDQSVVTLLRSRHLVRALRVDREDCLDTFHDQIRSTLLAELGTSAIEHHTELARAHEAAEAPRPEALAYHLSAAGDRARAAEFALRAARAAEGVLAYDRAAAFLRSALEWLTDVAVKRDLHVRLGHALARAGHGAAAAEAFLAAAAGVDDARSLELRYLAAENLLRSGHVAEAMRLLDALADDLGVTVGSRRARSLLALLWRRLRLRVRGTGYRTRAPDEVAPLELRRVDALGTIATGLGVIDHVKGAVVQGSHLLAALALGEETRIARALAAEAVFRAAADDRTRAEHLAREIELLAQRLGDARSLAWSDIAWGACAYFGYRFDEAVRRFGEGAERLRAASAAVEWEETTARQLESFALLYAGRYRDSARGIGRYLPDAIRRNDLYARNIWSSASHTYVLLVDDRPDEARRVLSSALDGWPDDAYYLAHVYADTAMIAVLTYEGRAQEAREVFERMWARSRGAGLHHIRFVARDQLRIGMQIAIANGDVARAERAAATLARTSVPFLQAYAHFGRAALALQRGDTETARRHLAETVRLADGTGNRAIAAPARIHLGRLIGGDQGELLVSRGMRWLRDERVVAPDRVIAAGSPGFPAPR